MKAIHQDNLKPSKEIGEDYVNLIGREINCMGDGSIQPAMRPYLGSLTRGEEKNQVLMEGWLVSSARACLAPLSSAAPTRLHLISFLG
jgi:hypothetical protein